MLCYIKTTKDDVVKHSNIIGIKSIIHALDNFTTTGDFFEVNIVYNKYNITFEISEGTFDYEFIIKSIN